MKIRSRSLSSLSRALPLSIALLAAGCGGDVGAGSGAMRQALPGPVSGSDIVAQRAFVGDLLLGLEAGGDGSLYELGADDAAGMASTTKSFTLLMATEAVAAGKVSLDDIVTISWKAANIDNGHSGGGHSEAGFPAGEQVRFEDLLYAVMLPSGGDASIAVAQHVAVSTYPYLESESDAAQEAAFVTMMNDRAQDLGLTDTTFHNPYGGDHFHADDNTPGEEVDHVASTRNMTQWFAVGMQDPLFRAVAGFQGTYAFNALDGTPYSFGSSFGYPGMAGQKGGSNGACGTCVVGLARRIGRDLLVAYTQGQGGDGTVLLDYGYQELFHPVPMGQSAEWTGGWVDSDLACVTGNRAASAVALSNGTIRVLLWGHDVGDGDITHLNPFVGHVTPGQLTLGTRGGGGTGGAGSLPLAMPMPDGDPPVLGLAQSGGTGGRTSVPGPGSVTTGGSPPFVTDVRIAHAGNGNLMVVADTDQGVHLYSYGITAQNTIVLRDIAFVGDGSDGRVFVPNASLVVTAHRGPTGNVTLKSFRLTAATGKLGNSLDTYVGSGASAGEIELTGRAGLATSYHLVLAYRASGDGAKAVRPFTVWHQSGDVVAGTGWNASQGTHLSVAHVKGFGTSRDLYALASRDSQGRLRVESYEYMNPGTMQLRGATTDTLGGPDAIDADATLRVASYREGGVFVTLQPSAGTAIQKLEVWSLDPSATTASVPPGRVWSEPVAEDGLHAVCRVPDLEAEGDFLVATGASGQDGISLRAFRSAPRK